MPSIRSIACAAACEPTPVMSTSTSVSPIFVFRSLSPRKSSRLKRRSFRQAANSASTANVTNTRMVFCFLSCDRRYFAPKLRRAGLKSGHHKYPAAQAAAANSPLLLYFTLSLRRQFHFPGTPRRDVSVFPIPTHRAFQRRCHRLWLESEFALRARNVHEHSVLRDLHAFDGDLRLAPQQARESCFQVSYTQRQPVGELHCRRGKTRNFGQRIQELLQR